MHGRIEQAREFEGCILSMLYNMGFECRSVSAFIDATGLTQTNVSFHLRILREAGLVRAERRGPFVYYCLADPDLLRTLNDLKRWLDTHSSHPILEEERNVVE